MHSNYGYYLFTKAGLGFVVNELTRDKDSRRALVSIFNSHQHLFSDNNDVPCTATLGFRIRDGALNMTVHMRSQDAIYGLGNDLPFFNLCWEIVAIALNIPQGRYHHFVESFHVYERHFNMLNTIKYYLLAMGGAIWSTPISLMLEFPAKTFIRFFENHGLLTITDHPQWYTVKNGSREYIKRLTEKFADDIFINSKVTKVVRDSDKVIVYDEKGGIETYDQIIFACHADQALKIIENPSEEELSILSNFIYQPNKIVVHSDESFMPKRKGAWASWVYLSDNQEDDNPQISLSYWMNNLQPLQTKTPIIATLNPARDPSKNLTYDEYWFDHPVFDASAINAQEQIQAIQGKDRFWFCGAYCRYGFHEDGLWSAFKIAEKMGIKPSWT